MLLTTTRSSRSFFIFVSSTVYITAYNDTAVDYTKEVKENPNATSVEGNNFLYNFITSLNKIEKATRPIFYGVYTTSKINSEALKEYQFSLYDFDNQLIESSGWIQYLNKNLSSNDTETKEDTISFSNSY